MAVLSPSGSARALDSDDFVEQQRAEQQCRQVRAGIEQVLNSGARTNQIMKTKDVHDYMRAWSDEVLDQHAKDSQEKLRWLLDAQSKYAPMMVAEAQKFNAQLWYAIEQAEARGGLTKKNIAHLKEALSRRSGDWTKVKDFFENTSSTDSLAAWQKNWKAVADKIQLVREKERRLGRRSSVLQKEAFTQGSVMDRLGILNGALAELNESDGNYASLRQSAKGLLTDAAQAHGLARSKITPYLDHIFAKYSGPNLQEFIQTTLPKHVNEWIEVAEMYSNLRTDAMSKDVPYLSEAAFLELSYKERRAEVTRLKQKLGGVETSTRNPMLEAIQHLVNEHEWTKARTMIVRARNSSMHQDDRKRLFGLERLVEANGDQEQAKHKEAESLKPLERYQKAAAKLQMTLHEHASEPMRRLYERALWMSGPDELMRLRTINTGFYNIKWGVDHHFINSERLESIRARKEADTERVKEEGHTERGVANIDLGTADKNDGEHSVYRKYEEGHRGPTYYHFGRDDVDHVMTDVNARMYNTTHNYWYLLAPEDTKLDKLLNWHQHGRPAVLEYMSAKRALAQTMSATQIPSFYSMASVQNVKEFAAAQSVSLN